MLNKERLRQLNDKDLAFVLAGICESGSIDEVNNEFDAHDNLDENILDWLNHKVDPEYDDYLFSEKIEAENYRFGNGHQEPLFNLKKDNK